MVQDNPRSDEADSDASHSRDDEAASNESPLDRDLATERNQAFNSDPPIDPTDLHELESDLEGIDFPTTGRKIVAHLGNQRLLTKNRSYTIGELIPETDMETYDSSGAVRVAIQQPAVAAAMKRIIEERSSLPNQPFPCSQRKTYEQTFQELRLIDSNDEHDYVETLTDWIVEQIHSTQNLPGSHAVRQQAADMCRTKGYRLRNDEWLGI